MKDFLVYLLKAIVDHPDDVLIEEKKGEGFAGFYITVHPDDIGKVIGKGGKTIKSLRHLVNLKGFSEKIRTGVYLKDAPPQTT